ncbi:EutP/PduV family microcompartment system protein [Brevibacillus ginsengisoli]|uniref:EutP/PduV family microcompartment system protein n=1 Tax=Brevibacillus ginsengisoli TaxID=363854 RepID=UPI003CECA256
MKKIIFMGQSGSGKTSLCQKLHEQAVVYKKTQAIETFQHAIDTPGEYMENRFYYKALIVTSVDADVIGLVQDCTATENYFPPSFASVFAKPVIGIVSKVDLATDAQVATAKERLREAGASSIFEVSAVDGTGIEEIKAYLETL